MPPKRPTEVNICGKVYSITYCDNPAEVDIFKRSVYWGQIDHWTRSIRVYAKGLADTDVWHNLLHEIIHGIVEEMKLKHLENEDVHDDLDVLALGLVDTFSRNGWVEIE